MFLIGDKVRISPRSLILNNPYYEKYRDTIGTVIDIGFNKCFVKLDDISKWFYNAELMYSSTQLTKSEKFIFTHTNYAYCTPNIFDICTVIKFFDDNYDDVVNFISECNKYADISQPSFIIFNKFINDDIHNAIDTTRFSIKINKNYVDVMQNNCIVFNLKTNKLNVYSEDMFNKIFRLIDKIYPIN